MKRNVYNANVQRQTDARKYINSVWSATRIELTAQASGHVFVFGIEHYLNDKRS